MWAKLLNIAGVCTKMFFSIKLLVLYVLYKLYRAKYDEKALAINYSMLCE